VETCNQQPETGVNERLLFFTGETMTVVFSI